MISVEPTSNVKSSETPNSDSSDGSLENKAVVSGITLKYLLTDASFRHQNASSRTVTFKVFTFLKKRKIL